MEKLIKEIEKLSDKYQFIFQFWGVDNNNVFIMKDFVELYSTGGHVTAEASMIAALQYVYKINRTPVCERVC